MTTRKLTRREAMMEEKLKQIERDPVAYYARVREAAYRDELRKALLPWTNRRRRRPSS